MSFPVSPVGWAFSTGISYGLQRVFYTAPTKTHVAQLLGSASMISGIQLVSTNPYGELRLLVTVDYFALQVGIFQTAVVALTFFINLGFQLIRSQTLFH